ncbi:MAG TPA: MIP/aquaporin family protein [Candidatus Dormibacteraeota bacterium]|jgi:arsenate reductase|nr:MIP/aquaporin family protein [Candidatus Dormibacteraeota bacterium]
MNDSALGLGRRLLAEFLGTAMLLAAVVGSGIAAQRLSPSDTGLELLENSVATGLALVAIILAVGPISGAHLNPVVTMTDWLCGGIRARTGAFYVAAQLVGGVTGVVIANLMFGLSAIEPASKVRWGMGLWIGELVATYGLLLVVFGVVRSRQASMVPIAVGSYIAAAYWFTSSTSFANPAVTIARTLSDTFAGIAPRDVAPFVIAQVLGALAATVTIRLLFPDRRQIAEGVTVPHPTEVKPRCHACSSSADRTQAGPR